MELEKVNQSQEMLRQGSAQVVLELLRVALGHSSTCGFSSDKTNWKEVMDIASTQGVLGVCFDAFDKLPAECRPDMDSLMDWLGQASYMETCYEQHRDSIEHLAAFYDSVGVKMMLLKGYGLSKYYPVPNHRPVGDIDIYLGHLWEYADQMVASKLGIEVDNGHHHHSVFTFEGVMVENHYDFINIKDHPSSKEFERVFKQKAEERLWVKDNDIQNLYYPSAEFNALFLLKHAAFHFASTEMTLRQLLDWLLFVKAEHSNVDWNSLYTFLREQKLDRFANILNAIGVKYLGFPKEMFYEVSADEVLINRVLADILSPEFEDKEDGSVISGLWVKPRRFWHNRWKHKLCYKDSLWTGFWMTLYSKLQKPSHFRH